MRVLHVEDDVDDALLIGRALQTHVKGIELRQLASGEEALAYLKGESPFQDRDRFPLPELLLVDLKMLGISGLDVLEWLSRHQPPGPITSAILSSSNDTGDQARARAVGANAYFIKGMSYSKICEWINELRRPRPLWLL